MSLTFGQASVGTVATNVLIVPPGVCNVTIANTGTVNTAAVGYVSSGTGGSADATAAGGFVLNGGAAVSFSGYPGSTGSQIWIKGGASPATFSWVISTGS